MSTRSITPEDYARIVHTIRVTIHSTGYFFEGDTRSGNHASIYLLTSDGRTSIRLNMVKAGPTDTMGTFKTSHCNYRDTTSSIYDFDIKAVEGLTVSHVLSLLEQKRRSQYRLARSGVGCRYWVQTIVNDFNENGFIDPNSPVNAAAAIEGLRYNYSRGKEPEFEEVDPGTFV
ncbi:hypothetical protein BGZ57DRAFT_878674 [Hyaloscypha finlandica]|nr:hypothetical protein BGZ57DRAFT_878674 [Hyaloscypha finlandica]